MSKRGKVIHSGERNLLYKLMTFFEQEKNQKIKAMKSIVRLKNKSIVETCAPSEIELKFLENEKRYQAFLKLFDNVVKRTAAATGVSERTLRNIKIEAKKITSSSSEPGTSNAQDIKLRTPKKRKMPKKRLKIDDFMVCSIRNIIDRFYTFKKEVPTLRKILAEAKKELNFPGQKVTLWKIIKNKLEYRFSKCKYTRQYLIPNPEIAAWRARYLRILRENDDLGVDKRPVIYLDETCIHNHYTVSKCRQNATDTSVKKKLNPGQRWILVHAGGDSGFVKGAEFLYKCKSTTGDYQNEIDVNDFTKYIQEKLLPNLPANSILVLDNAPYHNRQIDKPPTSVAQKEEMQNWLQENGILYDPKLTKQELYYLICRSKPEKKYEINEIVKNYGHEVLRLPPYQCDLNPIENLWKLIKQRVAKNVTQSEKEIEKLTLNAINSITEEDWNKEINRVDRLRQLYWECDRLQELNEKKIMMSVSDESDNSDTEWSESSDTEMSE